MWEIKQEACWDEWILWKGDYVIGRNKEHIVVKQGTDWYECIEDRHFNPTTQYWDKTEWRKSQEKSAWFNCRANKGFRQCWLFRWGIRQACGGKDCSTAWPADKEKWCNQNKEPYSATQDKWILPYMRKEAWQRWQQQADKGTGRDLWKPCDRRKESNGKGEWTQCCDWSKEGEQREVQQAQCT